MVGRRAGLGRRSGPRGDPSDPPRGVLATQAAAAGILRGLGADLPRPPPGELLRDRRGGGMSTQSNHVVIRASAGTGKTYQLTNRFLRLLLDGVPPQRILATTF